MEKSKNRHDRTTNVHESLLSSGFKEAQRKFSGDLSSLGTRWQKLQRWEEGLSDESVFRILNAGAAHMQEEQPRWAFDELLRPFLIKHLVSADVASAGHHLLNKSAGIWRVLSMSSGVLQRWIRRNVHPKIPMVPITELRWGGRLNYMKYSRLAKLGVIAHCMWQPSQPARTCVCVQVYACTCVAGLLEQAWHGGCQPRLPSSCPADLMCSQSPGGSFSHKELAYVSGGGGG